MQPSQPVFDRCILWDVDYDRMDLDAKWRFVIERVFAWGDVEDIRQCRRYYGDERAFQALAEARRLPYDTLLLISAIFDKPVEDFVSLEDWKCVDPKEARVTCMMMRENIHRGVVTDSIADPYSLLNPA